MGKTKKQTPVWLPFLKGVLISMGIYLLGLMVLTAAVLHGTLGEKNCFVAVAVLCLLSAALGGLLPAHSCPWGTVPGGLLSAAIFAAVLICCGALWWDGISWTGHGGILLLCALGGGIPAGMLSGKPHHGKRRYR